jgi:hypothetical protein
VDKVGGLGVIRTQCVLREFHAILHELKNDGFLDVAMRHAVVQGSTNEDALNNCFMTDRQLLILVKEQSLVPSAFLQTITSPHTSLPVSPKPQAEESNDTVQVDGACSPLVLPAQHRPGDAPTKTSWKTV